MKNFDKEKLTKPVYQAFDCRGDKILVGDVFIGAYGTGQGYVFKGEVIEIFKDLIKVKNLWYDYTLKVAPKRIRVLRYEEF